MLQLSFIEHAQVQDIFARLDADVRLRLFVEVDAYPGAGANQLLQQWVRERSGISVNHIVWTNLVKTNKRHGRPDTIASPITCTTFARAFFALRLLKNPLLKWEVILDEEPTRIYDDERFLPLFDRVVARMRAQGIRVWIVHQAQLLDTIALEYIANAWKECDRQFCVILLAKLQAGQTAEEPLRDQFAGVTKIQHYRAKPIEVRPVEEEEFCTEILAALFEDLDADFSAEVERAHEVLAAQAWAYTSGRWDAITRLATEFDLALGTRRYGRRRVTQEVVNQVFNRLKPALPFDE